MLEILNSLVNLKYFATSCVSNNFFGFPAWYKYLDKEGKIAGDTCTIINYGPNAFQLSDIRLIVLAVIEMAVYAAGVIAVFMIIWGGFRFITSQGSPESIKSARETILYAIIGLIVSISARVIINFVTGIF